MVLSFPQAGFSFKSIPIAEIFKPGLVVLSFLVLGMCFLPKPYDVIMCIAFGLFYMHICIALTFEGFQHFSRYRLSQKHPVLDRFVSVFFIVAAVFLFAPIALFLQSYSLLVSPDEKKRPSKKFYNELYFSTFLKGVLSVFGILVYFLKFEPKFNLFY